MAKIIRAKRIVEVGCFTGYSAICLASALPPDDKLYTLDINPGTTAIAQRYFALAGLQDEIELKPAPALNSLLGLEKEHRLNSFDLMFIEADKENQAASYEWGLKLVRSGDLILTDNVLWSGAVIDQSRQDASTKAIRAFNDIVQADPRVDRTLLHISDGLYVIRKK